MLSLDRALPAAPPPAWHGGEGVLAAFTGSAGLSDNANQAEAGDFASVIILANELRAALVEKGLIKGSG